MNIFPPPRLPQGLAGRRRGRDAGHRDRQSAPAASGRGRAFRSAAYQVFRNACPRNCYDTCSIKTYVKDGVVQFVEGAPESTFTKGGLCVKGLHLPPPRLQPGPHKIPHAAGRKRLRPTGGASAGTRPMDRISDKILEIKKRDGSLLGLGLTKYSGNFGITNYGVEGMMSSLGYTTRFVGTPCWPPASTPRTTTSATCGAMTRKIWSRRATSSSGEPIRPGAPCTP